MQLGCPHDITLSLSSLCSPPILLISGSACPKQVDKLLADARYTDRALCYKQRRRVACACDTRIHAALGFGSGNKTCRPAPVSLAHKRGAEPRPEPNETPEHTIDCVQASRTQTATLPPSSICIYTTNPIKELHRVIN
jgi:hypothetical protein